MQKQEFKNNKIVIDNPVFRLHVFNYGSGTPVLVCPPHAGRSGNIAQKMIDKCVGCDKTVYAYELLSATNETANVTITDLVEAVHTCQQYINEPVDLICLCQGAWLGAIYTALYPETVTRYANFAGPINCKTGQDNIIEKYCETASLAYHRLVISMSGGIQPGYMQWLAFAGVAPNFVFIERYLQLGGYIANENTDGIKKWHENNSWYDTPYNLAGVWFLDCLENHFMENRLYDGAWEVGGHTIDLSNIACPVYLYAGDDDQITHPQQVFDMAEVINTPQENIHMTLFEGAGHTKVFVGRDELNHFAEEFFKGE